MTGIFMMAAGAGMILVAAAGFYAGWRILSHRKRRIREEGYQIYD